MNTESTRNSVPEGFCGTLEQYNRLTIIFSKAEFSINETVLSLLPFDLNRCSLFKFSKEETKKLEIVEELISLLEFINRKKLSINLKDQMSISCKIEKIESIEFLIRILNDNFPQLLLNILNNNENKRVLMRYDKNDLLNMENYQNEISIGDDLFKWIELIKTYSKLSKKLYEQRGDSTVKQGEIAFNLYYSLVRFEVINSTSTEYLDKLFSMDAPKINHDGISAEFACVYDCMSIYDSKMESSVLDNNEKYKKINNWIIAFVNGIKRTIPYNTSKFVF